MWFAHHPSVYIGGDVPKVSPPPAKILCDPLHAQTWVCMQRLTVGRVLNA